MKTAAEIDALPVNERIGWQIAGLLAAVVARENALLKDALRP